MSEDVRREVKDLGIGGKIRQLRQERRMTLQDLSDLTGLSKPLLSQVENEQVIPPIATLLRISKALKTELSSFFQEANAKEKCVVVRSEDRKRLTRGGIERPDEQYSYHSLAYGKKNRCMEPFIVEFRGDDWKEDSLVSHEGEEFSFILEGEVEMKYADQTVLLKAGDSVYYDSNEVHGFVKKSDGPARAIAVVYLKDH